MRKLLTTLFALTLFSSFVFAAEYKDDLKRMDDFLTKASDYLTEKEDKIASLERMLGTTVLTDAQRFDILEMLYHETFTYKFERTLNVLNNMEALAKKMNSLERTNAVKLFKAESFSTAGVFLEAQNLIETSIDTLQLTPSQKIQYFNIAQRFYGDYREFTDNMMRDSFIDKQSYYRSRIFTELDSTDVVYKRVLMETLMGEVNYDVADRICDEALAMFVPMDHNYAVFSYYKAMMAKERGDIDMAVHWFVESACSDIRGSVKDNASLFSLALLILPEREVTRAFNYTRVALEDALFYNSRLRPFQIARSLPAIQDAYEAERSRQSRIAAWLITVMSVILVLLFMLIVVVFNSVKKEKAARKEMEKLGEELKVAVANLSEANEAKEVYLGLFLSMCSNYLDKLRKHTSMKDMEEELKNFYNTFDNAFLHLYPNFVNDFNSLLKKEEQIELKKDELLNTELRIFALIRLGITQSSHIASLLRYSVNTIYNYRAQVKKAALEDPETFEDRVKVL